MPGQSQTNANTYKPNEPRKKGNHLQTTNGPMEEKSRMNFRMRRGDHYRYQTHEHARARLVSNKKKN